MYIELHSHSNFTFLDGASHPEDLVARARELGQTGLALTDRDGLYGVVRHWQAATDPEFNAIVGAEVTLEDGAHLILLAKDDEGYRSLSQIVTSARTDRPKGSPATTVDALDRHRRGLIALSGCLDGALARALASGDLCEARRVAGRYRDLYGDGFYVEVQRHLLPEEDRVAAALIAFARAERLPAVATNDVRYARRGGQRVHDVLTAVRLHTTLAEAGTRLRPNDEYHLKSAAEMLALFPNNPNLVERTVEVASRCSVQLKHAAFRLPAFGDVDAEAEYHELYRLVHVGALERYFPMTQKVNNQLTYELGVIEQQKLAGYFLIVWDIVRFCKANDILCQGRGSAANSAVCYALGITAVEPIKLELLFERFLSEGRDEVPDIDIDIAHRDRERVIQYVYEKYTREKAAMVAEVISYRRPSAVRDVGKALGFTLEQVDRISKSLDRRSSGETAIEQAAHTAGLDPASHEVRLLVDLCDEIQGFPRHMSIHVGGMVISADPIASVVPVEPATMPNRTVIAWDKDDAAAAGLVKVDLLGLGMLTLLGDALQLVRETSNVDLDLGNLPQNDTRVYEMLQQADTIGVFQVESRAQMNTLPRLKPKDFYDIAIEVAIIRPGPIQGGMVHPYLRRRAGDEPHDPPHPSLKEILARTCGVPLFQEQLMRVAITASGFTPSEADRLRRAMGSKRSKQAMDELIERLRAGMRANEYDDAQIDSVVGQITGFANYGFPESHALSFAYLVYASAYLKCHHPVEFYCALLNAQPMGFYSPMTIAGDARRHGVPFLPVDVDHSAWLCRIEGGAVRLGLGMVRGIGDAERDAVERAIARGPFASAAEFARVGREEGVSARALEALAAAGALSRASARQALWEVLAAARGSGGPLGVGEESPEPSVQLGQSGPMEAFADELRATGLWIDGHPLELLRARLARHGILRISELGATKTNDVVEVAGIVICRQRPPTAKGMLFLTLEDETGLVNVTVIPQVTDRNADIFMRTAAMVLRGMIEREGTAVALLAISARDLPLDVSTRSRDFH